MTQILKEGEGWRLGWKPEASVFQGLVGGYAWAFELTAAELNDFCRLVQQLDRTMHEMAERLMDEEKLTCEAESDRLWLEATGYPDAYELRLIVQSGRAVEGCWEATAVPELVLAVKTLKSF
ncbi:MAG: DUF1818 family protein [Cyanobacteria bacterium P01_H01_bin.121]